MSSCTAAGCWFRPGRPERKPCSRLWAMAARMQYQVVTIRENFSSRKFLARQCLGRNVRTSSRWVWQYPGSGAGTPCSIYQQRVVSAEIWCPQCCSLIMAWPTTFAGMSCNPNSRPFCTVARICCSQNFAMDRVFEAFVFHKAAISLALISIRSLLQQQSCQPYTWQTKIMPAGSLFQNSGENVDAAWDIWQAAGNRIFNTVARNCQCNSHGQRGNDHIAKGCCWNASSATNLRPTLPICRPWHEPRQENSRHSGCYQRDVHWHPCSCWTTCHRSWAAFIPLFHSSREFKLQNCIFCTSSDTFHRIKTWKPVLNTVLLSMNLLSW